MRTHRKVQKPKCELGARLPLEPVLESLTRLVETRARGGWGGMVVGPPSPHRPPEIHRLEPRQQMVAEGARLSGNRPAPDAGQLWDQTSCQLGEENGVEVQDAKVMTVVKGNSEQAVNEESGLTVWPPQISEGGMEVETQHKEGEYQIGRHFRPMRKPELKTQDLDYMLEDAD